MQKLGGVACLIDAEHAYDRTFAECRSAPFPELKDMIVWLRKEHGAPLGEVQNTRSEANMRPKSRRECKLQLMTQTRSHLCAPDWVMGP
eukprot:1147995-Pelagomonas_calceolata.AAC.10